MRSMMLVGLLALLVNQQPGDDTPRIGNCRTLPNQVTCLTASSDFRVGGLGVWPDLFDASTLEAVAVERASGIGRERLRFYTNGSRQVATLSSTRALNVGPTESQDVSTTQTLKVPDFGPRHQTLAFGTDAKWLVHAYPRVCWERAEDGRRCVSMEELLTFIRLEGR